MSITVLCFREHLPPVPISYHNESKKDFNLSTTKGAALKTAKSEQLQKFEDLFNFLKILNEQRFQNRLRSLVQECKIKGTNYLKEAKTLDLEGFNLTEIPQDFSLMEKVSYLCLRNNNLSSLPDSLFSMANSIRKIDLGNNQFRTLPKVVYDIAMHRIKYKKYIEIYLWDNPIDTIPQQIKSVICTFPHNGSLFSSSEADFPHIFPHN